MNTFEKGEDKPNIFFNNSWEIEILMSGGAVFSLYQLSEFMASLIEMSASVSEFPIGFALLAFTGFGIRMLGIYFAIHLSLRAFWLSMILLKKIYPQGVNRDKINLADPFRTLASRFDVAERIAFTDRLSGLIFAWSVTFLIVFVGISVAFMSVSMLPNYIIAKINHQILVSLPWRIVRLTITISLLMFLIDTFFYGVFRRSGFLARFFYPVYLFWNSVTLGFVWRPNLQIIFSNVKNRWKAASIVVVTTVLIGLLSGDKEDFLVLFDSRDHNPEEIMADEKKYLNKRSNDSFQGSFIQSDVITDDYLQVYVNYNIYDDLKVDSLKTEKKYFSKIVSLSIDDSVYSSPTWVGMTRINGEKGIQTVVDISHLENKMHILKIVRDHDKNPVVIPFWKQ